MTTYESALSELSTRLIGTGSNLTSSLSEILAAALQELIEAELTAVIDCVPGGGVGGPCAYTTTRDAIEKPEKARQDLTGRAEGLPGATIMKN